MRVSNLFSGLISDGYTGESMRHISRRSGRGPYRSGERLYYLVSDYGRLAKEDKAKATSWRYDWFEPIFLQYIVGLNWAEVAQEAAPAEEAKTRTRLAAQKGKLDDIERQLKRLADLLSTTEQTAPQTLLNRMAALEKEATTGRDTLISIAKEAATYEAQRAVIMESGEKIKALVKNGDYDSRLRLREEIRRKINRIDVYAKGVPEEIMKEQPISAPDWPAFRIKFTNGIERWVFNESRRPDKDSSAILDFDPAAPTPEPHVPHVY